MMKKLMIVFFVLSLSVNALVITDEKIILEGQEIFIGKAEIIVNKMPAIGSGKNRNYIIVTLMTGDGKKIKAKYTVEKFRFHSCTEKFSAAVQEKRGDLCVVRNLPSWAGQGTLVILELKDSKGKVYKLSGSASVTEVH